MPPTRATRQQRKAAGTEASPFQALDTAPNRKRATRKKAAGKENGRRHISETKTSAASVARSIQNEEEDVSSPGEQLQQELLLQNSRMTPENFLSAQQSNIAFIPPCTPSRQPTVNDEEDELSLLSRSPVSRAQCSPDIVAGQELSFFESVAIGQQTPAQITSPILVSNEACCNNLAMDSTFEFESITVCYSEPGIESSSYRVDVPKTAFLDFLAIHSRTAFSHYSAPGAEPLGENSHSLANQPLPTFEEKPTMNGKMNEAFQQSSLGSAPSKPQVSRLRRALDKKKKDDLRRAEEGKSAAERAKQKAEAARAKAAAARANAAEKARKESHRGDSLVPDTPSPSSSPSPPRSFGKNNDRTHFAVQSSAISQTAGQSDNERRAHPGSGMDVVPETPSRWGLTSVVSNSIGKLNPFSYFGRRTPSARTPSAQPPVSLLSNRNIASTKSTARNEHLGHKRTEDTSMEDVTPRRAAFTEQNHQQALTMSSPEGSEQKLLEYIAKTHPALLANPQTVENLKATLNQYEILEKVRAHQRELEANKSQPTMDQSQNQHPTSPVAGVKRKRKDKPSPSVIPNPEGRSYGMDLDYFCSSSSSEGEEDQGDKSAKDTTPPTKKQKRESELSPNRRDNLEFARRAEAGKQRRARLFGHPNRPQPYLGDVFAEPDRNIFGRYENFPASSVAFSYAFQNRYMNPPRPSPSHEGAFSVPEDSSSSGDEEASDPATAHSTTETTTTPAGNGRRVMFSSEEESSDADVGSSHGANDQSNAAATPRSILKGGSNYIKEAQTQAPPPAPTPAHATLPAMQNATPTSDALAMARAQANKYAPKVSSNLRESSRMSSSPIAGHPTHGAHDGLALAPIADKAGSDFETGSSPLKHYTLNAFDDLDLDPVVASALADMGDGFLPNPLADLDISDEVLAILDQMTP